MLTLKEGFTFLFLPRTFDAQNKQIPGEHQHGQITFKLRSSFSYKASQINISLRLEKSKKKNQRLSDQFITSDGVRGSIGKFPTVGTGVVRFKE